ncbi:putative F-box protein At3g24580 [Silene latifolia]|uniref:putative F-box protein At3g24580 n=1 Tax=Silene latifolia TaxID=37657 RepID=UPI003D77F383
MNCLPSELLFKVLTHLPSKDLLKLRVVCKLWNSIICDRSFHQHHLDQLRKNNIGGFKYYLSSESSRYFSSVDIRSSETLATTEKIELCKSYYDDSMEYSIMGYVDGVLLARTVSFNNDENGIFLWNPTLGKIVDIPLYGPLKEAPEVTFGFGFGLGSVSNGYKVVALSLEKNDLKIKVYNLDSRSWTSPKVKRGLIDNVKHFSSSRSVNFEGCVYWLAKAEITTGKTHYLCFNLSSEALTCAKLPDVKYVSRRHLAVLHKSLALVDESNDDGRNNIGVWIRRRDSRTSCVFSWIELYNLDFGANTSFIYLMNDGNLYFNTLRKRVIVYDLKTGMLKPCSQTSCRSIEFMDGFLGSLALLT